MSISLNDMVQDSENIYLGNKVRLTQKEKDSNNKAWYKSVARLLARKGSMSRMFNNSDVTEFRRKKSNYDLFNNRIDMKDFEYVCKPFGAQEGQLPANFSNRDIISGKIKVLLGMEMSMPFSWRVQAINEDATSRKEQEEFNRIKQYVESEIMRPVRMQVEQELQQQTKGKELTFDEKQQLQKQIQEETEAQTPPEVRKYMAEKHQDPAELLNHQILQYLIQNKDLNNKFNKGWKHLHLSGEEIYYVGELNLEPYCTVTNPLYFEYDMSPDLDFIEDGEWAICDYRMSPSSIVAAFSSELDNDEIDRIYSSNIRAGAPLMDADWSFTPYDNTDYNTIRVSHKVFKSLKKIGFLTFRDEDGETQSKMVDENYIFNEDMGDIELEWEWIPEAHEVYQIFDDIFVYARPVPGQFRDLDDLYTCKLPYYGAAVDNLNSLTTASMDRAKGYQYFYDILIYRIELLLASDKGKILAMNIGAIPKSSGIDMGRMQYFMEANHLLYLNPSEEGLRGGADITNMVKDIDMSMASKINDYIALAEYIERKCGESIGVTKPMEGQIGPTEAVTNTKQNLTQTSHIVRPYFELHNTVKKNVLNALLETAKICYSRGKPKKLSYILDDMSLQMFSVDQDLLNNSIVGLYVGNSAKASEAKQAIESLAQAAMQNQQATFLDIITIIESDSTTEAKVTLQAAADKARQDAIANDKMKTDAQEQQNQRLAELKREEWAHEKDMLITKEKLQTEREIQKQTILSMGFDVNKDEDNDNIPDVLEVAKYGVDADIKMRKQALDEEKFIHQKGVDKEKLALDARKIQVQKNKPVSK